MRSEGEFSEHEEAHRLRPTALPTPERRRSLHGLLGGGGACSRRNASLVGGVEGHGRRVRPRRPNPLFAIQLAVRDTDGRDDPRSGAKRQRPYATNAARSPTTSGISAGPTAPPASVTI